MSDIQVRITDVSTPGHSTGSGWGWGHAGDAAADTTSGAVTSTFQVSGMTCAHCVAAVTEEVRGVPGVSTVAVDLGSGLVTMTGNRPVDEPAVRAAVEDAGYELVPGSL